RLPGTTPPKVTPVARPRSLLSAAADRAAWVALGAVVAVVAARYGINAAPQGAATASGFADLPAEHAAPAQQEAPPAAKQEAAPVKKEAATPVEQAFALAQAKAADHPAAPAAAAAAVAPAGATVTALTFTPADVGTRGLAAVRRCFGAIERPVAFGAGLF